jgi:two-component sensor histidine kinase
LKDLGKFQWKRVADSLSGRPLAYTKKRSPLQKTTYPKKKNTFHKRKLSAHAKQVYSGRLDSVNISYHWVDIDTKNPDTIKAAPFYFKDNSTLNVKYSDNAHGFVSSSIINIAEDEISNIWMISQNTLIKFDGINYYKWPLAAAGLNSNIYAFMYNDSDSAVWISTSNGIIRFKSGSFQNCVFSDIDNDQMICETITKDSFGRIWLSTRECGPICFRVNGGAFRMKSTKGIYLDAVSSVYADHENNLWMTNVQGVYKFTNNGVFHLFSQSKELSTINFLSCYENQDGIWLGGFNCGLIRIHNNDTLNYSVNGGYFERIFFFQEDNNQFWYSIYGFGVVKWLGDDKFYAVTAQNGLTARNAFGIFLDSNRNLWVGDLFSGISRINENIFYKTEDSKFSNAPIINVKFDDLGHKWCFVNGDFTFKEDDSSFTTFVNKPGVLKYEQRYLFDGIPMPDGSVWAGSYSDGIVHISEKYYDLFDYSENTYNKVIFSCERDLDNNVWFSTQRFGIIKLIAGTENFYHFDESYGLLSNKPGQLLNTLNSGLLIAFDEGLQKIDKNSLYTLFVNNTKLSLKLTKIIDAPTGEIIMGTSDMGVLILKDNTVFQISTENGLQSNEVQSILLDREGNIWLSSNEGISAIHLDRNYTYHVNNYNYTYGNFMRKISNMSYLNEEGYPIWGTYGLGLFRFDSANLHNKNIQPSIHFIKTQVNGNNHSIVEPAVLFPDQNIEILYDMKFWGFEDAVDHYYALIKESDNDTILYKIATEGRILLNNLLPGKYFLKVAIKKDNTIYYSNDVLYFDVYNFWYKSFYFYIFLSAFLIYIVFLYFKNRSKRVQIQNQVLELKIKERTEELLREKEELLRSNIIISNRNKEKDALVHEIHHRVKNNLQYISAILNMQIRISNDLLIKSVLTDTARRLDSVALVHELLYNQDNIATISTSDYIHQLCGLFGQVTGKQGKEPKLSIDSDDVYLDTNRTIALGIITLEIINNAIKHAFPNIDNPEIKISLKYDQFTDFMNLSISDNGNGGGIAMKEKGAMGKRLVDIFARQIKGSYDFIHNQGTIFKLSFKYGKS